MKFSTIALVSALALACSVSMLPTFAQDAKDAQILTPSGTFESSSAGTKNFTGNVRVDRIFEAKPGAPYTAALVTFEPGARTNWHSHIGGQHLIVVSGVGRTGTDDGTVYEFKAGDEIWCPANVRHWHGAAPKHGMSHIAVTTVNKEGKSTDWFEPVTDEQYNTSPKN